MGFKAQSGLSPTTLATVCLATDTTLSLTSTSGFPANGVVSIDAELVAYTAVSGNTLTGCSRGYGGSVAAFHVNGAKVYSLSNTGVGVAWQLGVTRFDIRADGRRAG
jgi:hypothetical protein